MAAIQMMISLIMSRFMQIIQSTAKIISKIKIIELKWAKHFPDTLKMLIMYTVTG